MKYYKIFIFCWHTWDVNYRTESTCEIFKIRTIKIKCSKEFLYFESNTQHEGHTLQYCQTRKINKSDNSSIKKKETE